MSSPTPAASAAEPSATATPPPAPAEKKSEQPRPHNASDEALAFDLTQRKARLYSTSTLVPKEYQGNIANCVIALNIAHRIGADELMVMQNLVIVHGKPTWSSQFLIATFNENGRFTALRYDFFGERDTDGWGCRAWAIEKATGERLVGTDITIQLAKDEGWYARNGSKWKSMPQQMLMYRAAAWLVRAYAPEIAMGLHTSEEIVDAGARVLEESIALTEEQLRERAGLLARLAQANIQYPDRHAAALVFLGYEPNQNPEKIPLESLRALAAQVNGPATAAAAPAEVAPAASAAPANAGGALFETPAPARKK